MTHESTTKSSTRHRLGVGFGAVLVLIAAGVVAEGADGPAPRSSPGAPPRAPSPSPLAQADDRPAPQASSDGTAVLPNLVGHSLRAARTTAREAGFLLLDSHDATSEHRSQLVDRNWKVCSQTPPPGTRSTLTEVDFGTVRQGEHCPR
ncbi:PASTA domain-containing protein [Streptomyces sp. TR06-5]|uniref:PASTA domain-containing protein n=1 Tax=unclassified Streptomyces TaxID=2593676 RepID=UPI0039A23DC5